MKSSGPKRPGGNCAAPGGADVRWSARGATHYRRDGSDGVHDEPGKPDRGRSRAPVLVRGARVVEMRSGGSVA